MTSFAIRPSFLCAATFLLATSAAADVTILGQPGSYSTIQAAIDAASDGSVIEIEPGFYAGGFSILDKSLTLVVQPEGHVQVSGLAEVRDLSSQRSVSIVGLTITAPTSTWAGIIHPGLTVQNNAGHVRLQDCYLRGGRTPFDYAYPTPSGPGLRVIGSPRVFVTRCTLMGREYGFASGELLRSGGDGIYSSNSAVALYGSEAFGGDGSHETYPAGGTGGAGIRVEGWGLFASGSSAQGGMGGGGDYIGCTDGGDGGHALILDGSQVHRLHTKLSPGSAGNFYTCNPGSSGQEIDNSGGVVQTVAGSARGLTGPVRTTDQATTLFTVTGEPGDTVWLLRSRHPGFQYYPALRGIAAIPYPWAMSYVPAGTIGAGGSLDVSLTLSDLVGPQPAWTWTLQALISDSSSQGHLSNPVVVVIENT